MAEGTTLTPQVLGAAENAHRALLIAAKIEREVARQAVIDLVEKRFAQADAQERSPVQLPQGTAGRVLTLLTARAEQQLDRR